jgi:hypothetical protein
MATLMLKDFKETIPSKTNNGIFNIVGDYAWTLSPSHTRQKDVPQIILIEHEQSVCTLWAQLSRFIYSVNPPPNENVYKDLYFSKPTGTTFYLPYFEPYNHNLAQSWIESKGVYDYDLVKKMSDAYVVLQKAAQNTVGAKVNLPYMWNGSQPISYTINFHLFNTTGNNDDIKANLNFKDRILMSALHDQRTILLASPPALFEVVVPGIRVCPAAVISQLNINNVGQMNQWDTPLLNGKPMQPVIIPDAWEFNITIQELITESRQIYQASRNGDMTPVRAMNSEDVNTKILSQQAVDATGQVIEKSRDQVTNLFK